MTAINLPGQLELPLVVDHKRNESWKFIGGVYLQKDQEPRDVQIAKLLR